MKRWIDIDDRSAIAAIRRLARRHASLLDFSEQRIEELSIVVTEATTNIVRYAGNGRALIDVINVPGIRKLVLLFTDNGPGIDNIDLMMQDGASTSASAGLGLGAIKRLSDTFDIFTSPENGTTIVCSFEVENVFDKVPALEVDALRVCHPAENTCGDGWMIRNHPSHVDILLCDGLGHGPMAEEASIEVIELARRHIAPPSETIEMLAASLSGHRGAVAAMIRIGLEDGLLSYSGLGNITTLCVGSDGIKRFPVKDGRIGGAPTSGFDETRQLEDGDLVIMHSDGLVTLREAALSPALLSRSPLLIAGYLLDRMFRGRDDASIVVIRVKGLTR